MEQVVQTTVKLLIFQWVFFFQGAHSCYHVICWW